MRTRITVCFVIAAAMSLATNSSRAADQYFAGDGSAWSAAKWSSSPGGPFTSNFTTGNTANFGIVNGTGTGATIAVAGINATENFTLTATGGSLGTGGTVATFSVSLGKTLDLSTESFSTAAGTGVIKSGTGVLGFAGGTFTGGFTLNAGTIVARGVNAMGGGATETLTINGGTIAGSATRDFTAKYGGGITVGGDFQLGALASAVAISLDAANLTFSNNMAFGAATRAITIGANGAYTLGGVISGSAGTGVTVNALASTTGVLRFTGTNTYSGPTTINGGTLEVFTLANGGSNSSLGSSSNAAANLILNGGSLSYINNTAAGSTDRSISLGPNGGGLVASGTIPLGLSGAANAANGNFTISGNITASASSGSQTLTLSGNNGTNTGNGTLSGIISNGSGTNVTAIAKSGTGKWTLSGANTYSGGTTLSVGTLNINNAGSGGTSSAIGTGALAISGGTTIDNTSGAAITLSTNNKQNWLGDFIFTGTNDLNLGTGIVGLNDNTRQVTVTAGTLTVGGIISDSAVSAPAPGPGKNPLPPLPAPLPPLAASGITKAGAGTLVLTGANTYTGATTIAASGGTLVAGVGSLVSTSSVTVNSGGTLLLSGNGRHIGANTPVNMNGGTFNTGGFSEPNNGAGGLPTNAIGALSLTATSTIDFGASNTSILEFAGLGTHTASTVLQIINWDGVPLTGGSGDQLLFIGLATTFTTAYSQSEVSFNGTLGYTAVQFLDGGSNPYYEIVATPVPEPSTWIGGALALATLVVTQRRRLKRLINLA